MRKTKVIVLVVVVSIIIGICGCVKKEPSAVIPESKIEIDYDNGNEKGIYFYRDELKIYGKLFLPEGEGPFPVVILSSPMGVPLSSSLDVIASLNENGIAGVCFDFAGAVANSKSEGSSTDYSVLTEAADLTAVIGGMTSFPEIDTDNIFLWGHSIGGFVTTYVGCSYPDAIKGMILVEPSYQLHDQLREYFPEGSEIPDVVTSPFYAGGMYFEDALSFDIYENMPHCTEKTLIILGDAVPSIGAESPEYIERAADLMPDATIEWVEGATHQFTGQARQTMIDITVRFVKESIQ